jgi:hypothetical protein
VREHDFDRLARAFASGASRRTVVRYLGSAALGGLVAALSWPTVAAHQEEAEPAEPGEMGPPAEGEEPRPADGEGSPPAEGDAPPPSEDMPASPMPPPPAPEQPQPPPLFDLSGLWLAGNNQQAIVRQSGAQVIAAYPEHRVCRAGAPGVAIGFPKADDDVTPVMFEGTLSADQFTGRLAVCMLIQVTRPHWEMRPMRMTATKNGKALAGTWTDADGSEKPVSLDLIDDVCRDDRPTPASLDAARAALDRSATEVAFSPNGCTRYLRTLGANGRVASEALTSSGKSVLTWTHGLTESTGQQDMDLDGFFEWRSTVKRGPALKDWRVEINRFSPSTRAQTAQEIYTRPNDATLHVLWKRNDGSGKLVNIAEFDTGVLQPAGPHAGHMPAEIKTVHCSIQQRADIVSGLRDCRQKGSDCLRDAGDSATARKLDTLPFSRGFNVICVESNDFVAAVDSTTVLDASKAIDVFINRDGFFDPNRSDANRCGTLFHELLHMVTDAPHNPTLEKNHPRLPEVDQVYGCEQMCFNPNANRCHCAACLKTKTCDKRCQKFKECDKPEELGAYLPCPKHEQWFPKKSLCEGATKGLACFGIQCQGLDPTCDPPPPSK